MKKLELEKNLKLIKDTELDIELLVRNNEKLCAYNNDEIENLKADIAMAENNLKATLEKSGEDKLECKLGSVSWRKMPDEWKYQDEILMAWIISLPKRLKNLFLKITTTVNKAKLKDQIMNDNPEVFEKRKITDLGSKLFLVSLGKDYPIEEMEDFNFQVEGIEIEHQDPKFTYTIKKKK